MGKVNYHARAGRLWSNVFNTHFIKSTCCWWANCRNIKVVVVADLSLCYYWLIIVNKKEMEI